MKEILFKREKKEWKKELFKWTEKSQFDDSDKFQKTKTSQSSFTVKQQLVCFDIKKTRKRTITRFWVEKKGERERENNWKESFLVNRSLVNKNWKWKQKFCKEIDGWHGERIFLRVSFYWRYSLLRRKRVF